MRIPERIWIGPLEADDSEWVWNDTPLGEDWVEYVRAPGNITGTPGMILRTIPPVDNPKREGG